MPRVAGNHRLGSGLGLTELFKTLKVKLTVTLLVNEIRTDGFKWAWLLSNAVLLYYGGKIVSKFGAYKVSFTVNMLYFC